MEENVALDSSKQKKFVKSLKGIKKLIKKTDESTQHTDLILAPKENVKVKKRQFKRKPKGLVYLSHIPHGFFEHQMTEYFKQFGGVTNVRVIRSKRTGNSRGCAFVEFKEPAVADIVVETMNNYLMGKRIIKAEIVPPEKQRRAKRMNWSPKNNPGFLLMKKNKNNFNENKDEAGDLKRAKKIVSNLLKTKTKLNAMGIQFDFAPVDVPNELQDFVKKLAINEEVKDGKDKLTKKELNAKVEDKKEIKKTGVQNGKKVEHANTQKVVNKAKVQSSKETKKGRKDEKQVENNASANKKLKEKGVAPLDSFFKIDEDESDDSTENELSIDEEGENSSDDENEEQSGEESDDSAVEFDEEAYDEMDSSESLLSEEGDSEEESESAEEEPAIVTRGKNKSKLQVKQMTPKVQVKPDKRLRQTKRKVESKVEVLTKKPKFEKKNEKKIKKKLL